MYDVRRTRFGISFLETSSEATKLYLAYELWSVRFVPFQQAGRANPKRPTTKEGPKQGEQR